MTPIFAPVSPPKALAAFAVAHCRICIGVRPASFMSWNSRKSAGPWIVPMFPASVPAAMVTPASCNVFKFFNAIS